MLFYVLAFIGLGFFNTIIWAMITDVIDDAEVKNGIGEDGTIYSVYSFARKAGSGIFFRNGRSSFTDRIFAGNSIRSCSDRRNFRISCIVPIIRLTAVALALIFLYPLSKKRVEENSRICKTQGEKIRKIKIEMQNRFMMKKAIHLVAAFYVITNRKI